MYQYMFYISILFLYFISQEVLAEICDTDIICHAPYRCCDTKQGCCYDQVLHTNRHLRLQIWNLWYFWFLIIFMMMSCFGGCGYYRRRRLAFLTRSGPNDNRTLTLIPSDHRAFRGQITRGRQFNLLSYNNMGSGMNPPTPVSNLPPSYAEIVDNPNMYPATKIDLPPYAPPEKQEETSGSGQAQDGVNQIGSNRIQPPPYSECLPPPNQNGGTANENNSSSRPDLESGINNSNNH